MTTLEKGVHRVNLSSEISEPTDCVGELYFRRFLSFNSRLIILLKVNHTLHQLQVIDLNYNNENYTFDFCT